MKKIFILSTLSILILSGCVTASQTEQNQPISNVNFNSNELTNNDMSAPVTAKQATIKTNLGDITVEFYGDDSPRTVANFVKLASEGFYDNTKFHRVIKDFMIQGGDPLSKDDSKKPMWGTGGPGYKFADEFNQHKLVKGSLAMANSGPDTNGSQFFIVTADSTPWLDGHHTNFGQVIKGLDVVEKIGNVVTDSSDRPLEAVVIKNIELE